MLLDCNYFTRFYSLQSPPTCVQRGGGFTQAGASVRLGREQTMMLLALCQTRLHPRLRETARCVQFFIYSIFTNSAEVVPLSPAAIINVAAEWS